MSDFDPHFPEKNGHSHFSDSDDEEEAFLSDEEDHEILMHRDAHFGGSFSEMLDYYHGDHIGVNPEFDLDRIEYLANVERELGQNLASLILSGPEAELVAQAKTAYRQFKELYETDQTQHSLPRLIADLILSEEEEPEAEIEAVAAEGKKIVPFLLQVIRSDEAYHPLFPGYGYAPFLACLCLTRIKDPQAIVPLFEMLLRDKCFDEEVILEAFSAIGQPAKEFLLQRLKGRPLTQDNVHAAFGLSVFNNDVEVAKASFEQLQDPGVLSYEVLPNYLIYLCAALYGTESWAQFLSFAKQPSIPAKLKKEMENVIREVQK